MTSLGDTQGKTLKWVMLLSSMISQYNGKELMTNSSKIILQVIETLLSKELDEIICL